VEDHIIVALRAADLDSCIFKECEIATSSTLAVLGEKSKWMQK